LRDVSVGRHRLILAQRAGESFAARRLIFILPMVVVVEAMGVVGVANWIGRLLSPAAPATNNARLRTAWLVMAALLAVVAVASIGTLRSYYSRPKQDYRTAAEVVGIPEGTVSSRLAAARVRLRRLLLEPAYAREQTS